MVAEAHKAQCILQYTENQESGGRGGGTTISGTLSCTNYCFHFEPDATQGLTVGEMTLTTCPNLSASLLNVYSVILSPTEAGGIYLLTAGE